ncbi:putative bifunctional diguanylate cyclase/phosphodiesterase [Nitrococcus mobilis]|uniref:Diguanylate cyclase/phosphodiesterase n=1 Tax=Nitrococcus mobilis Nb-231 TaxID=314278 RepID=A4BTP2_9GAMM|nr:bifunctional diguanylate cyclase/phosphodiesterase [Nitrococcus mobilis]EAR20856.1 diguanylate cyclase/phosphodiesterase [Nitrococcus mobilis Nb-231]
MIHRDTAPRVCWRASSSSVISTEELTPLDENDSKRVLLLARSGGNREQLLAHLQRRYEVIEPDEAALSLAPFDLAVVEATSFWQWRQHLMEAKRREEPVFLPVMLVLSQRDVRHKLNAFWDVVDEFVVAPIKRHEFTERAAMLLRTRQLALTQRAHLAYLANHDRATDLPNKHLFMDRLINAVRDAAVLDTRLYLTVIHIPLTRIMKSLGHHGLERAAIACSVRIKALLAEELSLARLTTEEWGLIPRPGTSMDVVLELCRRIQVLAEEPITVLGEHIHISPRIGIGVYPDDAANAANTLDCAIAALSQAKAEQPVFYSRTVQHQALRHIRTEARLYQALDEAQFELWYQPQVHLSDRRPVGVEALIRWRLPSGVLVPPKDFMAVAETTGLIRDIDRWVLDRACEAMRRWRNTGNAPERISVNVSAEDIKAADFTEMIVRTLDQHQLPPPTLELELTETTLFEISDKNLTKLNTLREYGVSVAIDDFGTGYSSLSYLHRLPITTLKIDKAFVDDVTHNLTNQAITRTIVWLAKNFNLEVVAEGIETVEQARYLKSLEVHTGQGFLYGRPAPETLLRQRFCE